MKYRAVHFDMDGVIANTEPLHVEAEQQTCHDFDFEIDSESWGDFKGMTADVIFTHLLNNYGNPETQSVEQLVDHKTRLFLEMAQSRLEPIDGALDFLQWTRDNHDLMTLVTSSNRRVQECVIGCFGVMHYFDNIVTGDDVTNGKPNPEPYLLSLEQTGSSAYDSVVIEDSKSGILSALAAKCHVLAITTSHPESELREVSPTYVVDNYRQAKTLLKN
jgi:HAD superfamily hydrolase (TIGR01509 family)